VHSGDVFVWTKSGRAEVIGCIGSLPSGQNRLIFHEFHSLADKPLRSVRLGNGRSWAAKSAGVELKPVPEAGPPAAAEPRRLVQMRQLAREFSARMRSNTEMERLRLLPQPIFRFDTEKLRQTDSAVVDGAIFAYVWTLGTDPEILLLLSHKDTELWHARVDSGEDYVGPYVTVLTGRRTVESIRETVRAVEQRDPPE